VVGCVVLAVTLAAITALSTPSAARATSHTPYDELVDGTAPSGQEDAVWGWVRDNELPSGVGAAFVAYTSAQKTSILKKVLQGRMGGRLLPTTPATLAALAAVGTAYVGWRVYQHFTGGDQTLDMWLTPSNYQRIQRNDETCS